MNSKRYFEIGVQLRLHFVAWLFFAGVANGQGTFYATFSDFMVRTFDGRDQFSVFPTPGVVTPFVLAADPSGNVYVSDSLRSIYRFDSSGRGSLFGDTGASSAPVAITFGSDGRLYAATTTGFIYTFDSSGNRSLFATGPAVNFPQGMAFDSFGNLYVANRWNTIYRFDPSGKPTLFADAGLSQPIGLAFDQRGNLFVANSAGNSIYRFDPSGSGSLFANTDTAPARLAFNPEGDLYATFIGSTHFIESFDPTGARNLMLDVSRYGRAIDIIWVPEPSAGSLVFAAIIVWAARRRQKYGLQWGCG